MPRAKTFDEWVNIFKNIHPKNKYEYIENFIKNGKTFFKIKCNTCGNVFVQDATGHKKHGCKVCGGFTRVLKEIKEYKNDKYKIIESFIKDNHVYIKVLCKMHDEVFTIRYTYFKQGKIGCKACISNKISNKHRYSREQWESIFYEKYKDRYSYVDFYYKSNKAYFKVKCNLCNNLFETSAYTLAYRQGGCQVCVNRGRQERKKYTHIDWVNKFNKLNKNKKYTLVSISSSNYIVKCDNGHVFKVPLYSYNEIKCDICAEFTHRTIYGWFMLLTNKYGDKYKYLDFFEKNNKLYVNVLCKEHNIKFTTKVYTHYHRGSGCTLCKTEQRSKALSYNKEEWNNKINDDIHEVLEVIPTYKNDTTQSLLHIRCKKYDIIYTQKGSSFGKGHIGCPKCKASGTSIAEKSVADFVESLGVDVLRGDRVLLNPYEIDIYIPQYRIGIEYNGLIWHSEKFRGDNIYHIEYKRKLAESKNIRLINIYEDDWLYKQDIVKSIIMNAFNKTPNRVYGRNCKIIEIDSKTYSKFNIDNHLMGNRNAKYKIALVTNNSIVAVAGFSETELLRYTVKKFHYICGGLGKIVNWFLTNINSSVITYVDLDYFSGHGYKVIGFNSIKTTTPKYWYVNKNIRESRQKYQKHKLKRLFTEFDEALSEVQNCNNNGLYRIFGCSNLKLKKIL